MAFIPIDAKADVSGSKKGKLTPEQHAILNAWCLASKTGILDCLGKCTAKLNVVPIINSNEATVTFNKGYFVVCGRLVECEEGTTVTFQLSQQTTQRGSIVARFNLSALGNNELQIITVSDSGNLYTEDLNENPITGKYDFVLYDYIADMSLGTVRLTRSGNYIPDLGGKLEEFENNLTAEGKPLGGYDTSKGTIEERLTALGFKEGSVTLPNGNATVNSVKRQGNYCILSLKVDYPKTTSSYSSPTGIIRSSGSEAQSIWNFTIPENFRPKSAINLTLSGYIAGLGGTGYSGSWKVLNCSITTSGTMSLSLNYGYYDTHLQTLEIYVGYEAPPITN